ncbi:MAG: hypothetical protein AAB619_03535 [Patescibacteria group bacterium]
MTLLTAERWERSEDNATNGRIFSLLPEYVKSMAGAVLFSGDIRYTLPMKQKYPYILVGVVMAGLIIWIAWPTKKTVAPTVPANTTISNTAANVNISATVPMTTFSTVDLPERDPAFEFTMKIPAKWRVEYLAGPTAINIYDAANSSDGSTLARSKIFVQYYTGAAFRRPDRVSGEVDRTITFNNEPAQTYIVPVSEAKPDVALPTWWNQERHVYEIQNGAVTPFTYYVLAIAPAVAEELVSEIISSFTTN